MKITTASLLALALPGLAAAGGGGGGASWHNHKKYVSSEKLQSLIRTKDLVAGAQKLQNIANASGGNRAFGSKGHNRTVDYLYKTLTNLHYYTVTKQPFTEIYSDGTAILTIDGAPIVAGIMTYTPGGEAAGSLVSVANVGCDAADYPASVKGSIAFIARGICPFSQKSLNAKAAGATAAVIYNNVPGELSGTLGAPFLDYAPVVGISQEDSVAILAKLTAGTAVEANLKLDATVEERVSFNVIAETKGGDHDNVLIVGGHSDSVAAGPGIK